MWGVDAVRTICRAAVRMGYDRLALTDTDNLYGLWNFCRHVARRGFSPWSARN